MTEGKRFLISYICTCFLFFFSFFFFSSFFLFFLFFFFFSFRSGVGRNRFDTFKVYSILPARRQFQDGSLQLATLNESTAWKGIPMNASITPVKSNSRRSITLRSPATPQISDSSSLMAIVSPLLIPIAPATPRTPYTPR